MSNQSLSRNVFIIRGRDDEAYKHLVQFIKALGLEELGFDDIACLLGPTPFIADIVIKSIEKADAVIALFTPYEHAARYGKKDEFDKAEDRYLVDVEGETRWQARSNVLFEAGVAYGTKPEKTILVTIGTDVQLFSDIRGKHFVQLAEAGGKQKLRNKLESILGSLTPTDPNWLRSEISGDFASCLRVRWKFYDEIGKLEGHLRTRRFNKLGGYVLLDVVATIAWEDPTLDWRSLEVRDFMDAIVGRFSWGIGNEAYWWLVVYGFFQFLDTEVWFEEAGRAEPTWEDSIRNVRWTDRAFALIERCRARPRPPVPIALTQPTLGCIGNLTLSLGGKKAQKKKK